MNLLRLIIDKSKLVVAFHKPYDTSTEEGRSSERKRRIALTSLTSLILRLLTIGLPLITLKITYDYLNPEVYGLWSAITAFFALFTFSDMGLGNGLQTKLSQAWGKDDVLLCKRIISNTYILLVFISIILVVVFLSSSLFVDWASIMNAQSLETIMVASSIVFIIVIPKFISIPITIIQRTQLALQEGFRSDIWNIIGYLLNVLFIVIIVYMDLGKMTLLMATSFLPIIVSALNMFVYFNYQRKGLRVSFRLFDLEMSKSLLSLGVYFSVLSILTTIGLSMDVFIVARTCSLAEAGSYSIIFKVATIFSAVVGVLSAPLWGANGEALARGDINWVKKNTKRMSLLAGFISIFLLLIGLLLAKPIFKIWLGADFEFSFPAFFWLSITQVLLAFISPYFMILNASGQIKSQILLFAIYTPISFVLKYYLSSIYGVQVVPMIGAIIYMLIIVVWIYYLANKTIYNLQMGTIEK